MQKVRSKDGTMIAFDRSGQGPAIVMVAGAVQHRAIDPSTAPLAALLAGRFTVFHYDRRGRGDNGDSAPYSTEREIEDIDALITEAGGSAFVYGISSGAVLALEAAAHGLAISKLALYEPPFIIDDRRPPLPKDYTAQLTELIASGRPGDAAALFMMQVGGPPLFAGPDPGAAAFVAQMRQAPMWPAFEAVAPTLIYDASFMEGTQTGKPFPPERTRLWAATRVPTLVIDGGASPAWMHHGAEALAEILSNVQRRTLEGQTHMVAPEALAPVLVEFFAGVEARR